MLVPPINLKFPLRWSRTFFGTIFLPTSGGEVVRGWTISVLAESGTCGQPGEDAFAIALRRQIFPLEPLGITGPRASHWAAESEPKEFFKNHKHSPVLGSRITNPKVSNIISQREKPVPQSLLFRRKARYILLLSQNCPLAYDRSRNFG